MNICQIVIVWRWDINEGHIHSHCWHHSSRLIILTPLLNLYHFPWLLARSSLSLNHLTRKNLLNDFWPPIFTPFQKKVRIYFLKCVSDYTSPLFKICQCFSIILGVETQTLQELKRSVWTGLFLSLATLYGLHCIFSFLNVNFHQLSCTRFFLLARGSRVSHSYPNPFSYMSGPNSSLSRFLTPSFFFLKIF